MDIQTNSVAFSENLFHCVHWAWIFQNANQSEESPQRRKSDTCVQLHLNQSPGESFVVAVALNEWLGLLNRSPAKIGAPICKLNFIRRPSLRLFDTNSILLKILILQNFVCKSFIWILIDLTKNLMTFSIFNSSTSLIGLFKLADKFLHYREAADRRRRKSDACGYSRRNPKVNFMQNSRPKALKNE